MQALDLVVEGFCFFARALDNVIFPPHCLITHKVIEGPSPLPLVSQEGLDLCDPAPNGTELLLTTQRHITADEIAFSSVTSLWALGPEAPAHALMVAIKYGGHQRLARALGQHLGMYLSNGPHVGCSSDIGCSSDVGSTLHAGASHIVHVAVHRTRLRERGYDQARLIADGIGVAMGIPVVSALRRTRFTGTQTLLNDAQRAGNMNNAFTVDDRATVRGAHLLLVDDVFTTGATVNAAATALLEAGARRVDVVTLCATL